MWILYKDENWAAKKISDLDKRFDKMPRFRTLHLDGIFLKGEMNIFTVFFKIGQIWLAFKPGSYILI